MRFDYFATLWGLYMRYFFFSIFLRVFILEFPCEHVAEPSPHTRQYPSYISLGKVLIESVIRQQVNQNIRFGYFIIIIFSGNRSKQEFPYYHVVLRETRPLRGTILSFRWNCFTHVQWDISCRTKKMAYDNLCAVRSKVHYF